MEGGDEKRKREEDHVPGGRFNHAVKFAPGRDRPEIPTGEPQTAYNLLWHRLLTRDLLAADDDGGGFLRRELEDLLNRFPESRALVPADVSDLLEAGGFVQEDTSTDFAFTNSEGEVEVPIAAEQQRLREAAAEQQRQQFMAEAAALQAEQQRLREVGRQAEQQQFLAEAAAREAERERLRQQAVLAEYAARACPCCLGEIEDRTEEQQDLIDYMKTDGIHSERDENGDQISVSFHPQELFNELAIHLADNAFNDYNTEAVIRWKIQYLYNHSSQQSGLRADDLESADWVRHGLAMGDYEVDEGDDDRERANVVD